MKGFHERQKGNGRALEREHNPASSVGCYHYSTKRRFPLTIGSAVANAFEAKVSDPVRKPQGMNHSNTGSRFAALTNLRESEHVVPISGSGSKSTPNLAKESRPLFSGSASRFKVHGSMGRPQQ
ncbi:hypothetical protein COLO4_34348 [Corchorus olitorius]|uniref:Uncharacterized protein n=1 Tax=Corchorus olitorius TaxID=93759 RepID=A0A1R3GLD6_9ROSI|nr:hypothetical protein COLO4_34348 [Corchorus olitorius]